jgi:site-specific DNA-cytosine methylase
MSLRAVESFCGIGGFAAAAGEGIEIAAALDINERALAAYRRNFPHPATARTIESIPADELRGLAADLWWLSPPCQPYTRRGSRRDVDDTRAAPLLALMDHISEIRPRYLALENVPEFAGSESHRRLRSVLDQSGYYIQEITLCPTELGIPNRRKRFYLVAGLSPLLPFPRLQPQSRRLQGYLDQSPSPDLVISEELVARYCTALDIVRADDPAAITSCFTAAYGRSPVRSGSYLTSTNGIRRFSPAEILRLLGFPPFFSLPPEMPLRQAWPLVGNSLSVPAVQWVLTAIPEVSAV